MAGLSFEDLLDGMFEKHAEKIRAIIREELEQVRKAEQEKLLNSNEARKMFVPELSMSTLKLWTKEGKLTAHRIGGRVYYKQSEILEAAKSLKKYKH